MYYNLTNTYVIFVDFFAVKNISQKELDTFSATLSPENVDVSTRSITPPPIIRRARLRKQGTIIPSNPMMQPSVRLTMMPGYDM